MKFIQKNEWKTKLLIASVVITGLTFWGSPIFSFISQETEDSKTNLEYFQQEPLSITQDNSLLPVSNPPQLKVKREVKVVVTAYSSSPEETDDDPFITAAGTLVKDGIIANNMLPFGTKVRLPEIYGDKIFVVEDRMSWKKGDYHFDIWFSSKKEALEFGAKRTYIEILEE
ncbi:MAG: hypothetical protein CMI54_07950 [Parcubacteria group bacterium]|jgi:3D (Asp-Asp-Asp) domain-containing protein|nr:hypothetical protein [Parcubacteria group bacterium]|tara:strand:+ start:5572 stop:6084 length:513 start_codon:yes stop_codon:yes gene_type:complete